MRPNYIPRSAPEELLSEVIDGLAVLAVRIGASYPGIAELVKERCVNAAAAHSRLRNGRLNQSLIAAMTGLSRVEVKRILLQKKAKTILKSRNQQRAGRVIAGWLFDSKFHDRRGNPKSLDLEATRGHFQELVKLYSGDIPSRAILSEMVRLEAVAVKNGAVRLRKGGCARASRLASRLRLPLLNISNVLNGLAADFPATINPSTHEARLRSTDPKELALLAQRANQTMFTAIDAISRLGEQRITKGANRSRSAVQELRVTAFVTANKFELKPRKR